MYKYKYKYIVLVHAAHAQYKQSIFAACLLFLLCGLDTVALYIKWRVPLYMELPWSMKQGQFNSKHGQTWNMEDEVDTYFKSAAAATSSNKPAHDCMLADYLVADKASSSWDNAALTVILPDSL